MNRLLTLYPYYDNSLFAETKQLQDIYRQALGSQLTVATSSGLREKTLLHCFSGVIFGKYQYLVIYLV